MSQVSSAYITHKYITELRIIPDYVENCSPYGGHGVFGSFIKRWNLDASKIKKKTTTTATTYLTEALNANHNATQHNQGKKKSWKSIIYRLIIIKSVRPHSFNKTKAILKCVKCARKVFEAALTTYDRFVSRLSAVGCAGFFCLRHLKICAILA